jgi:GNAT superfamily N-acetyltransferase
MYVMNSDRTQYPIEIVSFRDGQYLERLREVRYRVLREPLGLPYSSATFDGDELETTLHYLAVASIESEERTLGCATLVRDFSAQWSSKAMQLRGMAVLPEYQNQRVGSKILQAIHRDADRDGWSLWCKARDVAKDFYRGHSWEVEGNAFEVPTIGLHWIMHRRRDR